MSEQEMIYPRVTSELAEQRTILAPKPAAAFKAFSQSVFAEGALSSKTKQLSRLSPNQSIGFEAPLLLGCP